MGRVWSRREFLTAAGSLALASSLPLPGQAIGGSLRNLFGPSARLTPAITPNDEFYVTSYRSPPSIDAGTWNLAVTGLVEKPIHVTYAQLLALPRVREVVTLECVGNNVAGDAISTAEWEGVPLKLLLEEARVTSKAYDLVLRAADGYSDSMTVERAMAGDVLVAHGMNGAPLPQGHGFPARIIVPGAYGMKHVQWLTQIELVDHDYQGYYQRKGWTDDAVVKTTSRIDLPEHGSTLHGRTYTVQGLAFAGTRGIRQVELSMDEGTTWHQADLDPEISSSAWRFWSYRWSLPAPGRYSLLVRATDGTGRLQTSIEEGPAPDGATGLHEITVTVGA